ncbi:MAG: RsmE family RNA methyltransferase [Ignavibacteriaceae bacterium]
MHLIIMEIHKSYSDLEHLSNIELFYSKPEYFKQNEIILEGDECRHAVKVMRHHSGDEIFVTNGDGKIFYGIINKILKDTLSVTIKKEFTYKNKFSAIVFCLPKLKNPERFEFALEKCAELGITNFIVFESERTISKSSKIDRWHKILLSAMKQSLQSFLPVISTANSIEEIKNIEGKKFIFEQNTGNVFRGLPKDIMGKYYFLFGPEGGFSQKELEIFKDNELFRLADNRLRSETAIIKCASLLTTIV